MKFDIKNPAFMQAACGKKNESIMTLFSSSEEYLYFNLTVRGTGILSYKDKEGVDDYVMLHDGVNSLSIKTLPLPSGKIVINANVVSFEANDESVAEFLNELDISNCKSLNSFNLGEPKFSSLVSLTMKADKEALSQQMAYLVENTNGVGCTLQLVNNQPYNKLMEDAAAVQEWQVEYI